MKKQKLSALLLTAQTHIAHGDPTGTHGNIQPFNRRRITVDEPLTQVQEAETIKWINEFAQYVKVPNSVKELVESLEPQSFVLTALIEHFLEQYATTLGDGIFTGSDRYERLFTRLQSVGKSSSTSSLRIFLENFCQVMMVDLPQSPLWVKGMVCPNDFAQWVIRTAVCESRTLITIAREWVNARKCLDPKYAEKAGITNVDESDFSYFTFDKIGKPSNIEVLTVALPIMSSNAMRHVMVREPLFNHMIRELGVDVNNPPVAEVLATFFNGGDLAAGAASRDASFWDQKEVLKNYPSLSLLSGCTTQYMLPSSSLRPICFIVCRENNHVTEQFGITSDVSVLSMLETVTQTRTAGRIGSGQMIHSTECLIAGTQILVVFGFAPYATELDKSALVTAIEEWEEFSPYIGGRNAGGAGLCTSEWVTEKPADSKLYRDYMEKNKDKLREGLYDKSLGTPSNLYV